MAKGKKVKPEVEEPREEEVETVEETETEEETVEDTSGKKGKSDKWPEGNATGRFHAVAHKDGFVVYNPAGQRVSNVLTEDAANDLVIRQNQAAQIKVKK